MSAGLRLSALALTAALNASALPAAPPRLEEPRSADSGGLEQAERLIEPGDIICRYCGGLWSEMFRRLSGTEKRFSHAGIVVRDNGRLWVIHAAANDCTGRGEVAKVLFEDFAAEAKDFAVYRVTRGFEVRELIALNALGCLGRPFDTAFDLSTDEALYCTELVWRCVNAAAGEEIIGTTKAGHRRIVALDDCHDRPGLLLVFDPGPRRK